MLALAFKTVLAKRSALMRKLIHQGLWGSNVMLFNSEEVLCDRHNNLGKKYNVSVSAMIDSFGLRVVTWQQICLWSSRKLSIVYLEVANVTVVLLGFTRNFITDVTCVAGRVHCLRTSFASYKIKITSVSFSCGMVCHVCLGSWNGTCRLVVILILCFQHKIYGWKCTDYVLDYQ